MALFLLWLVVSLLFQVVDYAIKEASELAHKEQAGFQDFVKEAHGKWRGLAFLSGGLMIATAMLSGLLNMMGLSLMGFSPFTACVNVYAFVCGVFTLILEYKDKADGTILTVFTGDVKYLIRTQVSPAPTHHWNPSQPLTATAPVLCPMCSCSFWRCRTAVPAFTSSSARC